MSIGDFLKQQASEQLRHTKEAVAEGAWVDSAVAKLRGATDSSTASSAIDFVEANKGRISGMGEEAFTLFVHQVSSGNDDAAAGTYVAATGSADDLIEAMDRGTEGLIDAKKELDRRWEEAWDLIKELALAGARQLLPLLLL
jgi:hypothetical protein